MATYDNIFYVLRLSPPNPERGLGWSVGESNPPGFGVNDQVYDPDTGHLTATFHWLVNPNNPQLGTDTVEPVTTKMNDGTWKHFKFYQQENTGFWLITDLDALINTARLRGLVSFADDLAVNPAVPHVGQVIPGT